MAEATKKRKTKRRGNGEGSISFRKDRNIWEAKVSLGYVDGKRQRRTVFGKTKTAVMEQLQKLQHQKLSGTLCDDEKLTVGTYLTKWLEDAVRPSVRESTYKNYETMVRVHIAPHLSGVRLSKLNPLLVQSMYSQMERNGASGRIRELCHTVLRKALQQAVEWQLIPRNVCQAVKKPRSQKREIDPLDAEQSHKLLEAVRGERLEALYVVALTTGLRQGELLGLHWEDVDLQEGRISVRYTLSTVDGITREPPKSKKGRRVVDLPEMAVDALHEHRKQMLAEGHAGCPWVFCNEAGRPLDRNNVSRRSFKAALKRAGLRACRFHDLRHTHATLLLLKGVHPKVVQERLGHANISITLDTYSHVLPSMQKEAAGTIGQLLSAAGA